MAEIDEQRVLAQWLNLRHNRRGQPLLWTHVPNGDLRHIAVGRRLKECGTSMGVPDVMIFETTHGTAAYHGVALELKFGKGRLSFAQQSWLERLRDAGWLCFVAHGADDAIRRLSTLGY